MAGLFLFLMTGCMQGDFDIALPNGWELSRWSSGEYVVLKTTKDSNEVKVRIGPTVARYQVIGHVVTGHVAASDFPVPDRPVLGYFVVDTKTDRVWQGLDERAWRQRLRELGVTEEPQLKWPTRHDRQYG
jgi:hypothetical protein